MERRRPAVVCAGSSAARAILPGSGARASANLDGGLI